MGHSKGTRSWNSDLFSIDGPRKLLGNVCQVVDRCLSIPPVQQARLECCCTRRLKLNPFWTCTYVGRTFHLRRFAAACSIPFPFVHSFADVCCGLQQHFLHSLVNCVKFRLLALWA